MFEKPAGNRNSVEFLKSTLAIGVFVFAALSSSPAYALVGGAGPDIVPCFSQNLGGGSATTALPPPGVTTNVISSLAGTLVTFDPSCSYLPVSTIPNQTFLYLVTWDFGDPSPDLFQPSGVPLTATPANLAVLLEPVSHSYVSQGVYSPINSGTPSGAPANLQLGPKLVIQVYIQTSITVNATATAGSAVLTGVSSTTGLAAGGVVGGVGIPLNTDVLTFTGNSITMNAAATITNTGQFTITILQPGPAVNTTGQVTIVDTNYPPTPVLQNIGAQPTIPSGGSPGVPVTITASTSFDRDGYIIWAAVNWGDGITELVKQQPSPPLPIAANDFAPAFIPLLPNPMKAPNTNGFDTPGVPIAHVYKSPGTYQITLSVIDNGRLIPNPTIVNNPTPPPMNTPQPLPFPLTVTPDPSDPLAALASIIAFHQEKTTYGTEAVPNHRFDPQLAQTFLSVTVPGSLLAAKSTFSADFRTKSNDKLQLQLGLSASTPITTVAAVPVSISIVLANSPKTVPLTLPTFTTDNHGNFRSSGLTFTFNAKKQLITLSLSKVNLQSALGLQNQTLDNSSVDANVIVQINGTPISTFVRYQYTSSTNSRGTGKNGHSIFGGSSK